MPGGAPAPAPAPPVLPVNHDDPQPQKRSLSRTLPVAVLMFTVVPLVIAGLLSLTESTQRLRQEQERRTRQTATLIAARVEQLVQGGQRLAALVAADPGLIAGDLVAQLRSRPEIDRVDVLDARGLLLAQIAPPEAAGIGDVPGPAPGDAARPAAPVWRARPDGQGMVVFHPVVAGRPPHPVSGWVAVGLTRQALEQVLALPADVTGDVRAALISTEGRPLLRTPFPDAGSPEPRTSSTARYLTASAPVAGSGWRVEVIESLDAYRSQVIEELLRFGAVVAAISLLSAWLAWRFARGLAQAIRDVARSARAILRGHYLNAHVELQRDDELGLLAQSFNHMSRELEKRERERDVFGRLVSPEVRDQLLQGELMLGGHEVEVTVLLSDIRGFTALCEQMKPRDIVLTLNEYFTRMTEAVQRYGGYINNFMGDAMVVVFGAPRPDPYRVERALYAAVEMQAALREFNRERATYGAPRLAMGIGLASGTALAGQIGSPERCIYTVIGDTVNVAARLEGMAKDTPGMAAFVNQTTYDLLPEPLRAALVPLGARRVKGRDGSVSVHALPLDAELPPADAHLLRLQEEVL